MSGLQTSINLRPGDEICGGRRYLLERMLGEGAFAAVFEARCMEGTRMIPPRVAIKVLSPSSGPQVAGLLKREISSLLALDSPYIPRVYDWGTVEGSPFVVMDLFASGNLHDQVRASGPLSMETAWRLLHDLLAAVNEAHRRSLLHLDIKPANVLLDGKGGFILTDFGISQALKTVQGSALTPSAGTPAYRAPEQETLDIIKFDARTDLFGVGLTVYFACTGMNLSSGGRKRELPPLSDVRRDADDELSKELLRLMAPDRAQRPGGAAEVLARVDARLAGVKSRSSIAGEILDEEQIERLRRHIVDPLLEDLCNRPDLKLFHLRIPDGGVICRQGEMSHHAFLLIHGTVQIEKSGKLIAIEARQGSFIGEIAALTGSCRTATVRARGRVYCAVFNAAELEDFLMANPAYCMRVLKTLALRVVDESQRKKD